jgi:phytoene dehydrogenase-like protein
MKSDVVIIGAGVSGLATGALLAKAGKRVTVLEKGNVAGGRANVREEKGFTLNYGAHGMYTPESGVLAEVMGRLGRPIPECGYPQATRSYWQHHDRFASMGAKPHQLMTTPLFTIGGRLTVAKIMLAIRGEKTAALDPDLTWGQWVASKTGDPYIHEFMMAFGVVNSYTNPASDVSAAWFIGHLQRSLFAKDFVGYMHGGWRSMYDAWIADIEAGGGTIVTGTAVDALEVADGRVLASIAGGHRYEAEAFVSTLPPQDAPALAADGSELARELRQWSSLEEVHAYCIDLGFDRVIRGDLSFVFDVQQTLYYSIHSDSAPDLAPPGCQLMHAMAYLTPEEAASEELRDLRGGQLRAGLDRYFHGWREAVVVERAIPDAKVLGARRTPANIRRLVPLRPAAAPNLFLANDARDIDRNLSQVSLTAALEVTDAIVRMDAEPADTVAAVA